MTQILNTSPAAEAKCLTQHGSAAVSRFPCETIAPLYRAQGDTPGVPRPTIGALCSTLRTPLTCLICMDQHASCMLMHSAHPHCALVHGAGAPAHAAPPPGGLVAARAALASGPPYPFGPNKPNPKLLKKEAVA